MHKTRITTAIIAYHFLIGSAAQAMPSPQFHGGYLGAELGTQYAYANQSFASTVALQIDPGFSSYYPYRNASPLDHNAVIAYLFTGYGVTWNQFYLSGELGLSSSHYRMSNYSSVGFTQNDGNLLIENNEAAYGQTRMSSVQFGAFLRPGFLMTPNSLIYGRIGTSFATIGLNTSTPVTITANNANNTIALTANNSLHKALFQLGAGLEQVINDLWTIRFDYLYSAVGSIQATATQTNISPPTTLTVTAIQAATINTQSVMIGVSYHFKN